MSPRRITVDRIDLRLDGLPAAQAELLAAQLQAALAAQPWPAEPADAAEAAATGEAPADPTALETRLAGPALVQAVAARLVDLVGQAAAARTEPEAPPWP